MTSSDTDNSTITRETTDSFGTVIMTDDDVPGFSTVPELSAPAQNQTAQLFEQQSLATIPVATAFSDSTTSYKIVLVSNSSTLSAGYTNTEPSSPLDIVSYSNGYWSPAVVETRNPLWYDNAGAPFGSGAKWISSKATTEGGNGDQWRLFKTDFNLPKGSTLISAQLWYTADNAATVYLNDDEIHSTGFVFGTGIDGYIFSRSYTVNFPLRAGSNTLKFVVRNWPSSQYNPTGLLYKTMIEYEREPLVSNFTGSPRSGTTPLTASFNDTSTGWPTFWNWSFGDGQFSLERNTSHTFTEPGNYTVSLTVSNDEGSDIEVKEEYINVAFSPIPYTFSITNTNGAIDKTGLWIWNEGAREDINYMTQYLTNDANWNGVRWKLKFSKEWPKVTKANFNVNPLPGEDRLNDATLHYHTGHGGSTADGDVSLLHLLDREPPQANITITPLDVGGKWGGNNKWVILNSCLVLRDKKWQNAFTSSHGTHGIMGYNTEAFPRKTFMTIFLENAKTQPVRQAFLDTVKYLDRDTMVQSPDGSLEHLTAAVVFSDERQAFDEYLPGFGSGIQPDADPVDPVWDQWPKKTDGGV